MGHGLLHRLRRRGWRFWSLIAALAAVAATFLEPAVGLRRDVYRWVFIVDVTQSMNARDYHQDGLPPDRLSFTQHAIAEALQNLPCGSEAGIGIFANKNVFLLFDALEVCSHYGVITDALSHLDWRMAWAGDSLIARGLYNGLRHLASLDDPPHLAFFTDGETTPGDSFEPPFQEREKTVEGLVVGVGGLKPVPLPKLDKTGLQRGFWTVSEAEHRKTPRYDPHGSGAARPALGGDATYLSVLRETELKKLAGITGLSYHRLHTPEALSRALTAKPFASARQVTADARWIFALAALGLIIAPYVPDLIRKWRR